MKLILTQIIRELNRNKNNYKIVKIKVYEENLGLVLLFGTAYNLRDFRPSCRIGESYSPYRPFSLNEEVRGPYI